MCAWYEDYSYLCYTLCQNATVLLPSLYCSQSEAEADGNTSSFVLIWSYTKAWEKDEMQMLLNEKSGDHQS